MKLTEQEYNQLPESLREQLARSKREHWGMFYDSEYWKDMEVIEDEVFRWLAGKEV